MAEADILETRNADLQQGVASIWRDALGKEVVDPQDDFFALGGDSVMVMNVLLRIEEQYGLYMDPTELFEAPTLGAFVERLAAGLDAPSSFDAFLDEY